MKIWSFRFALAPDDLLRDSIYRRLWASRFISSFGGQLTWLSISLTAAVSMHASPTQMGVLSAAQLTPYAVLSLPAGVILDRVRKLPVYIFGELVIALSVATVPVAWWLHQLSIHWLCLVAFVVGTVHTTAGTAAQLVLTQIVPRERLVEAHARNVLATSVAEIAGPGVAGALLEVSGAPVALLATAGLLLTSSLIIQGAQINECITASRTNFWTALWEGLGFVIGNRLLRTMAGYVAIWQMCNHAAAVVGILFATRALGLSGRGVGLSYMALGCGLVLASANGHRIVRRLGAGPTMVLGFATSSLGWLILAIAPIGPAGVTAYVAMLFMFGCSDVFIFINFLSLRQAVTPAPMLGRMTSTMRWLIVLPAGPGALLGGWLGEHFGLRSALGFAGVIAMLMTSFAWRCPTIYSTRTLPDA